MHFWLGSSAGPTLAFCHILGTIAALLYVVRLILMLLKKEVHALDLASRAMVFLCLIACIQAANAYGGAHGTALNNEQAELMPLLFVSIASLFEYVGFRFLDEWYEQMAAYREVKRQERAAKLRRKQALYFPGRDRVSPDTDFFYYAESGKYPADGQFHCALRGERGGDRAVCRMEKGDYGAGAA